MRCPTCGSTESVGPGYDTEFFCWECSTSFARFLMDNVSPKTAPVVIPVAIAIGAATVTAAVGIGLYKWIKNKI